MVSGEELDSLVHGHVEHVENVLSFEPHLQDIFLKTLPMTVFAGQRDVCHKLHLHYNLARSLTLLTASTIGVKREMLR